MVTSFNLTQSFNYTPYLIYKKRFKSEINSFCIWTPGGRIEPKSVGYTSNLLGDTEEKL